MRDAFITQLIKEREKNKNIVLLTGDLGFTLLEKFRDRFPESFINVGVSEQNMMSIAAGLALTGKTVFVYSIATFATMRPFEQIRTDIAVHNLPVIIIGSGAGLTYSHDSITHHAIEDIGIMRTIPNMTIFAPADPIEASYATAWAVKLQKPVYLRLGKRGEPTIYAHGIKPTFGKLQIIKKGSNVAIMATGNIVANALEAAKLLQKKHIHATVVSAHTIKPMDEKTLRNLAKKYQLLVSVEEHTIYGGLSSSIAEILVKEKGKSKFISIAIPDIFLQKVGTHTYLRELVGLSPKKIAERIYYEFKK